MRTVVIQSPWSTVVVEREIPGPEEGGALLRAVCGGICGSNLASYRGMPAYANYPRTIDHGFVAKVVEVGGNVCGVKPNVIVVGNPYFNCRTCYPYRRGTVSCCVRNETMDIWRGDVSSDYLTAPVGRFCNGQGIDPRGLAPIEPFCTSCHGVSQASVKPGNEVLVFDADAVGTLAGTTAKSFGTRVYIADITGEEVKAAIRDLHLDGDFVNGSRGRLDASVQEVTDGDGFDVTVEVADAPSTPLSCMQAAASRGYTVVIGVTKHSAGFSFLELRRKELDIYDSRVVTTADFAVAMELVKDGFVGLKKLIPRTYPAGSAAETFQDLNQNYGETIKAGFEF